MTERGNLNIHYRVDTEQENSVIEGSYYTNCEYFNVGRELEKFTNILGDTVEGSKHLKSYRITSVHFENERRIF